MDATSARILPENDRLSFIGTKKAGLFNIPYDQARALLALPQNPNGLHNCDVLLPWASGSSLAGRWDGTWIIDFGTDRDKAAASLYEAPFKYALDHIKPDRDKNKRKLYREKWWLHAETRPGLRSHALALRRCLGVTRHSKHLPFTWIDQGFLPDDGVFVFARNDDYFFGALQSAVHALWARRTGTQVREAESGFRYTPSTTFETFPLPWPPGKEDVKHPAYLRIAEAAKTLNEQRERWLNPPEWIEPLAAKIDAADTFEDVPKEARALVRQSAIMAAAAKDAQLKKRTLTNLYNERPTWLKLAHEKLDRAVLAAYAATDAAGEWDEDWAAVWVDTGAGQPLPPNHPLAARRSEVDQKLLANLLRLNHQRAG
jgi:hypothetical protein